jgi:hypothetical protein
MDSPTIVTNKMSSSLSQILYDNKKRFYQIFNLPDDVLFYEIENKISNNSYIYLIQCWNNININDDREIYKYIAKLIYHNLTKCDNEYWYFITAMMKFKHHITSLVDHIYNISQDQDFICNLFNFILFKKYSAEELLEYYQQLLINDKYIMIAYNSSFNYHLNSKQFIESSFISRIIENIFSSTDNYEKCISVSSEIVYQLLNISLELKNTIINWFSYFVNKNSYMCKMRFTSNICEDEDYEKNMIYTGKDDLKTYSCLLLTVWQKFIYDDFDISIDYLETSILVHKKDSRLFSDDTQDTGLLDFSFKKKTILTKLFHIIHKICDYSYFNLMDRIAEYDKMITDYTFLIASSRMIKTFDKLGKMKDVYKSLLDNKLARLKKLKKECQDILRDPIFNRLLSNFYNECFNWYNKLYNLGDLKSHNAIKKIPAKYIENTFLYYNHIYNDKLLQFDTNMNNNSINNLLHFCLNFIQDKNNVSNIYLRCKASTFLSYIFGDKKYIHYANNELCKSHMLISCIDLFIDVENTNSDNQFYLKLEPRYNMYFLFKGVLEGFSLEPDNDELCRCYRENLNYLSEGNFNKIRRLIVLNLYDLNFILDEIMVNVNVLLNSDIYTTESIIRSGNILKSDMAYCFEQLKFMELCSAHMEKIFISKEIIEQFIPMSLDYIRQLLDIKMGRLSKLKYGFDNAKIIKYFARTYLNISEHDIVVNNVIQDIRGYYENMFLDISKKLRDSNDLNEIEITHLEMFNELLIIQKSKLERKDEKNDIPDELLDPIMCSLIEEPVILPSSKNIMDKSVIVRHLLSDQMDPFNRDPLTIEKLEQYNETEEAKAKLEEFREKLNEFKKSNESEQE